MIHIELRTNEQSPEKKPSMAIQGNPELDDEAFDLKEMLQLLSMIDLRQLADIILDLDYCNLTDESAESIATAKWSALVVELNMAGNDAVTAEGWRKLVSLPNLKRLVIIPKEFYGDEEKLQALAILLPRLTDIEVIGTDEDDDWRLSRNLIGRLRNMCPQAVSITDGLSRQY